MNLGTYFTQVGIERDNNKWINTNTGTAVDAPTISTLLLTVCKDTPNKDTLFSTAEVKKYMAAQEKAALEYRKALASSSVSIHGNSFVLAPKAMKHKINDADRLLTKPFRYCYSLDKKTRLYVIKSKPLDEYAPILDHDDSQNVSEVLNACEVQGHGVSVYEYMEDVFHDLIVKIEDDLLTIYNSGKIGEELNNTVRMYLINNIPHILYKHTCKIEIYYIDNPEKKRRDYTDVRVWKRSTQLPTSPKYIDYISDLCKHSIPLAVQKLDDIPVPYSTVKGQPCHVKLDLMSIVKQGPCPTWDEYWERFTEDEAKVIRAFIWGIIDSTNTGRQGLYFYDSGYTGKSVVLNAISAIIGDEQVQALQKDSFNNQFSFSKIWDKRLVIVPDNKNTHILQSEKFHLLTGGDKADVEYKGQNSFSIRLRTKLIISGNTMPSIDANLPHERTRLILVKAHMTDKIFKKICKTDSKGNLVKDTYGNVKFIGDPKFEDKLKAERGALLYQCMIDYKELCPTGADIVLPDSMLETIYGIMNVDTLSYETFFNKELVSTNGHVESSKLLNRYMFCMHLDTKELATHNAYGNFIQWLQKVKGVTTKRVSINGQKVSVVTGINLRKDIDTSKEAYIGNFNLIEDSI